MHDFLDNLANHQYQKMYKDKDKEIEKSLEAYREAAKADAWLFGDYDVYKSCLLYTSPSPRDLSTSRMPSSA